MGNLGLALAPGLPTLARRLDDNEECVREASKVVLARYCAAFNGRVALEAPYVQKLMVQLEDEDPQVREDTAEALGNIGAAAASTIPQIVNMLLSETDGRAKDKALAALDKFRSGGFLGDF